ncbi:MAG: hypothetical protein GY796_27955 [Chloroflexi bacterium]|nr:hypothetical protein [Chloroflexota bacterium]
MNRQVWLFSVSLLGALLLASFNWAVAQNRPQPQSEKQVIWQAAIANGRVGPSQACPIPGFTTCIAVKITLDSNGSINETCTYSGNGGSAQGAANCNLRRAIREASLRPTADRPILIGFAIPTSDPNYDGTLDTWTILIDDDLPALSRENTLDTNGDVRLDGFYNTGGRADAPSIIVNNRGTGGAGIHSLEVESTGNTVANLSWKGGGSIVLKDDDNTVANVWVNLDDDGQSIFLRDPGSDPADLAGGGGISILSSSNSNVISGTVVAGTKFGRAINVDGDNNLIINNYIGTRADGTVPIVPSPIQCLRSINYDPANWYGGWGMQIGGSNNQVIDNIIAGLHSTQTANETPPMAIEFFGPNHLIQGNSIGVDAAANAVGVCGIGIFGSDGPAQILDNLIVNSRKGFEEDESNTAVYLTVDQYDAGGITLKGNIIRNDVPNINQGEDFRVINFTGATDDSLELFDPAQLTSINGTAVTGTSAPGSPCPNCYVDLYLDDLDDVEEALTYLGQATADAQGDFAFTLPQPLQADEALRTASTTQFFGTIGNFLAGTTTRLSGLQIPPSDMTISGPASGSVNTNYAFDIAVTPTQATEPFTYTITLTDLPPITQSGLSTAVTLQNINWATSGVKTINVTATNALGSVSKSHTITIAQDGYTIYLPSILLP